MSAEYRDRPAIEEVDGTYYVRISALGRCLRHTVREALGTTQPSGYAQRIMAVGREMEDDLVAWAAQELGLEVVREYPVEYDCGDRLILTGHADGYDWGLDVLIEAKTVAISLSRGEDVLHKRPLWKYQVAGYVLALQRGREVLPYLVVASQQAPAIRYIVNVGDWIEGADAVGRARQLVEAYQQEADMSVPCECRIRQGGQDG